MPRGNAASRDNVFDFVGFTVIFFICIVDDTSILLLLSLLCSFHHHINFIHILIKK